MALVASRGNRSFKSLCGRYCGNVSATMILKEMKHVRAVSEDGDGMLVAMVHYLLPIRTDPEPTLRLGGVVGYMGYTVAYKLRRKE